jgi:hypothetical protein
MGHCTYNLSGTGPWHPCNPEGRSKSASNRHHNKSSDKIVPHHVIVVFDGDHADIFTLQKNSSIRKERSGFDQKYIQQDFGAVQHS